MQPMCEGDEDYAQVLGEYDKKSAQVLYMLLKAFVMNVSQAPGALYQIEHLYSKFSFDVLFARVSTSCCAVDETRNYNYGRQFPGGQGLGCFDTVGDVWFSGFARTTLKMHLRELVGASYQSFVRRTLPASELSYFLESLCGLWFGHCLFEQRSGIVLVPSIFKLPQSSQSLPVGLLFVIFLQSG